MRSVFASTLHLVSLVGVAAVFDQVRTVEELLAENAVLRRKLKVAESTCSQKRRVVLPHSRSRFLTSKGEEAGSESSHGEGTEVGSDGDHTEVAGQVGSYGGQEGDRVEFTSVAERNHVADHSGGRHDIHCLAPGGTECTLDEKAEAIKEMFPEFVLSFTLIVFFASMLGLILLTKWKDADVRRSVYEMINQTLSIFCAVWINRMICDVWIYQIIPCNYPRGFGIKSHHYEPTPEHLCGAAPHDLQIALFFFLFAMYHFLTNTLIARAAIINRSEKFRFVVSSIGSHLRAFAAIPAFGVVQEIHMSKSFFEAVMLVVVTWIIFCMVRACSYYWICTCFGFGRRQTEEAVLMAMLPNVSTLAEADDAIPSTRSERLLAQQTVGSFSLLPRTSVTSTNNTQATSVELSMCSRSIVDDCSAAPTGEGQSSPEQENLIGTSMECPPLTKAIAETLKWSEYVAESEDESMAVCLGFLIMQTACYYVSDEILPVEGEDDMILPKEKRDVLNKWTWVLGALILLIILMRVGNLPEKCKTLFGDRVPWIRMFLNLQNVAALACCWTVFKHGSWFWREMLDDIFNPEVPPHPRPRIPKPLIIMAIVCNACALTLSCLILLLVLDFFADLEEVSRHAWFEKLAEGVHKMLISLDPGFCGCCGLRPDRLATIKQIVEDQQQGNGEHDEKNDKGIFRCLIRALGFLVGICWEKTFSEASNSLVSCVITLAYSLDRGQLTRKHEKVGPVMDFNVHHPLIMKIIVGSCLIIVVFVTWVKYLMPYARIGKAEHSYLQAAEEFGCNRMTPDKAEAVANNIMRQYLECERNNEFKSWRCQRVDANGRICGGWLKFQGDCRHGRFCETCRTEWEPTEADLARQTQCCLM